MLTLTHNGELIPIQNTEYYIRELANGLDEVIFNLSIWDPIYRIIAEEDQIRDRDNQKYLVKQIDAGGQTAKIVCQIDLDDWKNIMYLTYNEEHKMAYEHINAILPLGWTCINHSLNAVQRDISGKYTAYEVCEAVRDAFNLYIRWDNKNKHIDLYDKDLQTPTGAFVIRELNLKEINYKGKSNNLVTKLYAYGKDGLSFADINSGDPYVELHSYTNKTLCGIWIDEKYTDAQNLLDDARVKLAQLAKPTRSYNCSIVDLKAVDPVKYSNLEFPLYSTATLIDDIKNTSVNYQVVERDIYPYHPDQNNIIFDDEPPKMTEALTIVEESLTDPNSDYQQSQTENIKTIASEAAADKQDKLTAGTGIEITAQNVINCTVSGGAPNYTEQDQLTGQTWINGFKVHQKTIKVPLQGVTYSFYAEIGGSVAEVIDVSGFLIAGNNDKRYPLVLYMASDWYVYWTYTGSPSNKISFDIRGFSYNARSYAYVTVLYTIPGGQ